ncbi:MAG: hypothetical protein L0H84_09720 [Pseudonocardia sp.]|nr:hypothetical protein [Pseudonocardia sp.]
MHDVVAGGGEKAGKPNGELRVDEELHAAPSGTTRPPPAASTPNSSAASRSSRSSDQRHRQHVPAENAEHMLRAAARIALSRPDLAFRNPERLARGWMLQRADREAFVAHFGSDLVIVPVDELPDRMPSWQAWPGPGSPPPSPRPPRTGSGGWIRRLRRSG